MDRSGPCIVDLTGAGHRDRLEWRTRKDLDTNIFPSYLDQRVRSRNVPDPISKRREYVGGTSGRKRTSDVSGAFLDRIGGVSRWYPWMKVTGAKEDANSVTRKPLEKKLDRRRELEIEIHFYPAPTFYQISDFRSGSRHD